MSDDRPSEAPAGDRPDRPNRGRRYREIVLVLVLDLVGAAGALLISLRTWQVITTPRARPLRADVLDVTGRHVDAAPTALGLVALAGVVAVLATRGLARRVVGVVLAVAGAGLVWRAIASGGAVDAGEARRLVREQHQAVTLDGAVVPAVSVHALWPALTVACGVLVLAAGALTALHGHRWRAMSARYESAPDRAADRTRAAASLWSALDRGEDPTDSR